jgi:hypothetical protein
VLLATLSISILVTSYLYLEGTYHHEKYKTLSQGLFFALELLFFTSVEIIIWGSKLALEPNVLPHFILRIDAMSLRFGIPVPPTSISNALL